MSSARIGRSTGRNIGGGGLPANPRARSVGRYDVGERERGGNRDRAGDSDYYPLRSTPAPPRAAPTRSVRPQRPEANISSSYTDVPDVPPLPLSRRSDASSKSSGSSGSYSSASGSSSSFLDRMKGRDGYGSSRTSMEEEPEPSRKETTSERGGWLRQRTGAMPEQEQDGTLDGDDDESAAVQPGYGLSLWSRVATAANSMTISVSKAWASNIAAYSGEGTPPGEESRLTRALKAYHIEKARDPADLPAWLFEEHERRPLGRPGATLRDREDDEDGSYGFGRATAPPPASGRGLRDIYDAAAATTEISSRQQEKYDSSRGRPQDVGPPSKASDRLKALRDAKRNAAQRNASQSFGSTGDERTVREERGRGLEQDNEGPHHRSPSLPASVRLPHGGGLPPRSTIRKF
ncbi:hypothetical protein BJV74DRAFT_803084 [Russula compacta]|nr:hypothetical protein BJV74DRAFT_803084 [Russula compacta]